MHLELSHATHVVTSVLVEGLLIRIKGQRA